MNSTQILRVEVSQWIGLGFVLYIADGGDQNCHHSNESSVTSTTDKNPNFAFSVGAVMDDDVQGPSSCLVEEGWQAM